MSKVNVEKKDSFFKIMGPSLLAAINALLIFFLGLLASGKSIPIPKNFSIPLIYQFLVVSILFIFSLVFSFRSVTKIIRRYYASKQEYNLVGIVSSSSRPMSKQTGYRLAIEKKEYFFDFGCSLDNPLKVYKIEGPFCVGKDRNGCGTELRVEKTYFGRYKYSCDLCGKKHKSNLSKYTLKKRAERIFVSRLKSYLK